MIVHSLIIKPPQDVEAELGKKDSKYEDGPSTPIELLPGNNIISLQIPRNNINGWKMVGLNSLKVSKFYTDVSVIINTWTYFTDECGQCYQIGFW